MWLFSAKFKYRLIHTATYFFIAKLSNNFKRFDWFIYFFRKKYYILKWRKSRNSRWFLILTSNFFYKLTKLRFLIFEI